MRRHREEHFTEFRGHTLLKHGVLYRYVLAWIQILKRKHTALWVVDGFAGKGKDDMGNPGSPLLLARNAAQLREQAAEVRLIAVEPDPQWFDDLRQNLAEFDAEAGGRAPVAYLRRGTLAETADEAFNMVGGAPAFFFLDPFGADGLSLDIVRRVLALPKGEVFALFSHVAVGRHLAVLAATRHTDRAHRAREERPGLFPEIDDAILVEELQRAEQSDASLLPTQAAAQRILGELFGSTAAVEALLDLPSSSWGSEVVKAYIRTLREGGATHITRLGMFDEEQASTYYLIHAAKNPLAAFKMKEAIASATSKSDLPAATKHRIHWAHSGRMEEAVAAVLAKFADTEVRWTDRGNPPDCVKTFALSETDLSMEQLDALKNALQRYVIERRPLRFRFPAAG